MIGRSTLSDDCFHRVPRWSVQGRKLACQLGDVSVAGEPAERDTPGGHGVLGVGRFLAGITRR